jgi:hypothetical protein
MQDSATVCLPSVRRIEVRITFSLTPQRDLIKNPALGVSMQTRQSGQVSIGLLLGPAITVVQSLLKIFSDRLVVDFLFGGKVKAGHKTKFAVDRFVVQ